RVLDPQEHAHDDHGEWLHQTAQDSAIRVHLIQIAPELLQTLEVLRSRIDVESSMPITAQWKHRASRDGVRHLSGAWTTEELYLAKGCLVRDTIGDKEILVACRDPLY